MSTHSFLKNISAICGLSLQLFNIQVRLVIACEQAFGLGVWVFVWERGWGEEKERELAAMSHEFECRP